MQATVWHQMAHVFDEEAEILNFQAGELLRITDMHAEEIAVPLLELIQTEIDAHRKLADQRKRLAELVREIAQQ